jgi:hypothetical protein
MKWYEKCYRRHLVDMHIEDWNEEFLSEFSPEAFFENFKKANVKNVMIYFQSHVGFCYWPTESGVMHKAFIGREDSMRRLVNMCREAGIAVVGYYSPTYNNVEHDRHPEWRMVDPNGDTERSTGKQRYGLCCPNNKKFREFVFEQIAEFSEYFTVDGMFYDMPFWFRHCYCDECKARWEKECGGEIPLDISDERWQLFENKRREWMGEFVKLVSDETRRCMPGVSVEWNYAFAALANDNGVSEPINAVCDYVGGDICSDSFTQSFACKFYYSVTNNQPFEFMTSRCEPSLAAHTVTKTEDRLKTIVMRTIAHHGASLTIDAVDPSGTLNPKVYELLGKINSDVEKYEPFLNGEMIFDVGIYYSLCSKLNKQNQNFNNNTGSRKAMRTMIKNHIPVGILSTEKLNEIKKYPFLILSNPTNLPESTVDALIDYVKSGGTLYFSNADETRLLSTLLNAKNIGYTESTRTYVAPKNEYESSFGGYNEKYPLPFDCKLPLIEGVAGDEVLAHISLPYTLPTERKFSSIHSNPPGISTEYPAVVVKSFGKGKVIWSAAPFEDVEYHDYCDILISFIRDSINGELAFSSDAPSDIEFVRFDDEENSSVLLSVITTQDVDKAIVQPSAEVFVRTEKPIKSVELLPAGEKLSFKKVCGGVKFNTMPLKIFDMYRLEW